MTDATRSYPFSPPGPGHKVTEAEWRDLMHPTAHDGVYAATELSPTAGGLAVDLTAGRVWVHGTVGEFAAGSVPVAANTTNGKIVARVDRTNNKVETADIGTAALTDTNDVSEAVLCEYDSDGAGVTAVRDVRNLLIPEPGSLHVVTSTPVSIALGAQGAGAWVSVGSLDLEPGDWWCQFNGYLSVTGLAGSFTSTLTLRTGAAMPGVGLGPSDVEFTASGIRESITLGGLIRLDGIGGTATTLHIAHLVNGTSATGGTWALTGGPLTATRVIPLP